MIKAIIFDFFGVLTDSDGVTPNRKLLDYIKQELKPKYKIGVISNADADWIYEMLDRQDVKLFDDIVISHRVGIAKPEPAIYKLAEDNLRVRAEECVFVDDIDRFCVAAQAVGMKPVHYKNFAQTIKELETILATSADN